MRELSQNFIYDLINPNGFLHPILERVKKDHTLMLAIRKNYINIYYRGGNLLKIEEQSNQLYLPFFNKRYDKSGNKIPILPGNIKSHKETSEWVEAFSILKEIIDLHLSNNSKAEREFQQLIARENNFSTISNESEYFISDIEFSDTELSARFDMLAIQWLATQRKSGKNCRAVFIEVKYGDNTLDGESGLIKHLQDIEKLISNKERYASILETMESQFNQLNQLNLLNFNRCSNGTKIQLDTDDKPDVIFILANHNPRSTKLRSILHNPEVIAFSQSKHFNLRFFVSSFAGYGLHANCMIPLKKFQELLSNSKNL